MSQLSTDIPISSFHSNFQFHLSSFEFLDFISVVTFVSYHTYLSQNLAQVIT